MAPKSKRKNCNEQSDDNEKIPKVRYIPNVSRMCIKDKVRLNSFVTCADCSVSFFAIDAGNNSDPIPGLDYFNHLYECPQRCQDEVTCDHCWSCFPSINWYDEHLDDCLAVAELNRYIYNVPNVLGLPENGGDGLIMTSEVISRDEEVDIPRAPMDVLPFKCHIPIIADDDTVNYRESINCLGCSKSFPAAFISNDKKEGTKCVESSATGETAEPYEDVDTSVTSTNQRLVGHPTFYNHCILDCNEYFKLDLMTCCLNCLEMFLNSSEFNEHKQLCDLNSKQNDQGLVDTFSCVHCEVTFIKIDCLESHYKQRHPHCHLYKCRVCRKVFQTKRDMTHHEIHVHNVNVRSLSRAGNVPSKVPVAKSNPLDTQRKKKKNRIPLQKIKMSSNFADSLNWTNPVVSLSQLSNRTISRGKGIREHDHGSTVNNGNEGVTKKKKKKTVTSSNISSSSEMLSPPDEKRRRSSSRPPSATLTRPPSSTAVRPSSSQSNCSGLDGFRCDLCPIVFKKEIHLKYHKSGVHDAIAIRCHNKNCHKNFTSIDKYLNHNHFLDDNRFGYSAFSCSMSSTPKMSSQLSVANDDDINYEYYFSKLDTCTICGSHLITAKDQWMHFLSDHVGTRFRCPLCQAAFKDISSIECHCRRSHDCHDTITQPIPHFVVFKDT